MGKGTMGVTEKALVSSVHFPCPLLSTLMLLFYRLMSLKELRFTVTRLLSDHWEKGRISAKRRC